jgi:hypothetical protein
MLGFSQFSFAGISSFAMGMDRVYVIHLAFLVKAFGTSPKHKSSLFCLGSIHLHFAPDSNTLMQ